MSSIYTKSLTEYFTGGLNTEQLMDLINNNLQITSYCTTIYATNGIVYIVFNNQLTSNEEIQLDNVISSYTFYPSVLPMLCVQSLEVSSTTARKPNYDTKLKINTGYIDNEILMLKWFFNVKVSSVSQTIDCKIILNGTDELECISYRPVFTNNCFPFSGFKKLTLPKGNNTIQIDYSSSSGNGTTSISNCSIDLSIID